MGRFDDVGGTDAQHIEASFSDPDGFAILFDRHAVPLHRYIVKRVGRNDAEDLVGETFATAFRSRESYDLNRADARPWLFGIATNLSHHYWRAQGRPTRRHGELPPGLDGEDQSEAVVTRIFFQNQRESIGKALGQISSTELDVLLLACD